MMSASFKWLHAYPIDLPHLLKIFNVLNHILFLKLYGTEYVARYFHNLCGYLMGKKINNKFITCIWEKYVKIFVMFTT